MLTNSNNQDAEINKCHPSRGRIQVLWKCIEQNSAIDAFTYPQRDSNGSITQNINKQYVRK